MPLSGREASEAATDPGWRHLFEGLCAAAPVTSPVRAGGLGHRDGQPTGSALRPLPISASRALTSRTQPPQPVVARVRSAML